MASLPHQRPSQRAASNAQAASSEEPYQEFQRRNSQTPSTTSVDSQTLLFNDPTISLPQDQSRDSQQHLPTSQQQDSQQDEEQRKCWICFSDETEDTPQSSVWRSPCPCALTAHESCLLDWIADLEAPDSSRSPRASSEIRCPQCKSEIFLARPRSRVVETVGALEKLKIKLLVPAGVLGISYAVLLTCSHHGAHTIRTIFGPDDAANLLRPMRTGGWFERQIMASFPWLAKTFFSGWRGLRTELGLPLIPLALVASRTTMADAVLPILPIVFFATSPEASDTLTIGYWPPSAALSLVALPYLRGIYDEYLERVWGERERGWLKEIKPRLGRETDADNNDGQNEAAGGEVDMGLELGFEVIIEEDIEVQPNLPQAQQAPPLNAPPLDVEPLPAQQFGQAQAQQFNQNILPDLDRARLLEVVEELQPGVAHEPHGQPHPAAPHHEHHEFNLIASGARIANSVFGALLFPSIAAAMGEIIRISLPAAWTVPRVVFTRSIARNTKWQAVPTGLLQTRWGRSIVGGCLFVVLKDAVRIYCRWRIAKSHRQRRVLDWDKKAGKTVVDSR